VPGSYRFVCVVRVLIFPGAPSCAGFVLPAKRQVPPAPGGTDPEPAVPAWAHCTDGAAPALLSPVSAPVRWLLMGGYVYDIRDDQDHPSWQEGRSLRRCYSLLRSFTALHRLRAATPTRRARAVTGRTRRADVQCGTGAEIGGAGQDGRPGRLCQARLAAASMQCRMTAPDA